MSATATPPVVEYSMDELRKYVEHAGELGLPERERDALGAVVEFHAYLVSEIGDQQATIDRLRQLVFGAQTETKENVRRRAGKPPAAKPPDGQEKRKKKGHGRIPAEAYVGAEKVKTSHESLKPGDSCPQEGCQGKVYARKPQQLVRIRGSAPFLATVYEQERLRCNLCGERFDAQPPPGIGEEKYDETVASMVGMLRYGSGAPMNRIEELQQLVGVPFPASVQWELVRDAADQVKPAHGELIRQAAQGSLLYNDDTTMRILDVLVEQRKRKERGEPPPKRTGTFTSGIVSELSGGRRIVLYFTGQRHAGENLAQVLAERAEGLDPPIQMCDGLDRNLPGEIRTILSSCLVHGRRQFVDLVASFPGEVEHVVDELSIVYQNDERAKTAGMSAEERLRLHQEQSGPVMDRLKAWMEALLSDKKVEPNSGLGKAIRYVRKRWDRLTLFLRKAGAPLDNSLTERMLKRAILHRKNSLFYKTQNGADVGDIFMSLIATAKLAEANPFDYLNELQRHAEEVRANPSDWMPWNYRVTLERAARPD
ncbi:MAG: IS66 family transposase [bacterium]